jgi:hypothetical protein
MTPVKGIAAAMLPQPSRKAWVTQLAPDLPICSKSNRTVTLEPQRVLATKARQHGVNQCQLSGTNCTIYSIDDSSTILQVQQISATIWGDRPKQG